MRFSIFICLLSLAFCYTEVNTSRDSVKCLKDPTKKLCGWNLKSELSSRICCDLDDLSEECGQISGVTCSNDLEKLGDKAGYLLALPSEDCENTKFIAKDHSPLFLNISYVHPELVCVVKIRNKGSYSSRLRLIEDEFTNIDAFIYETDLDHTFFEKRDQFTSSEAISPVGDLRDFHIWYDNTSVIVVLAKDATQGHGVFKADLHPLPAFEDEIEHIEDHMKQVRRDWVVFAMFIIGVILVICVFPLYCTSFRKRDQFQQYNGLDLRSLKSEVVDPQQIVFGQVDKEKGNSNLFGYHERLMQFRQENL